MRCTLLSLLLSVAAGIAVAQNNSAPLLFPDSVQAALVKLNNPAAAKAGADFVAQWNNLNPVVQQQIRAQVGELRNRGLQTRPYLLSYATALNNAVTIEQIDAGGLAKYLEVSDKVIRQASAEAVERFFSRSAVFFVNHALHAGKSNRLYALNGRYEFDYIAPPEPVFEDEPISLDEPWTPLDTWEEPLEQGSQPVDPNSIPYWITPPLPPYVEGAVIRFESTDLVIATTYDSAALKGTKGMYAFEVNTFIGSEGVFGWSPALLNPDSVYVSFTEYFFDVSKPEILAEATFLNYVGKTPGRIAGQFEFRTQSRRDSTASSYPRFKSYLSNLMIEGLGGPNLQYRGGFSLMGPKILSTGIDETPASVTIYNDAGRLMNVRSREFAFADSSVEAERASLTIFQGNDSIVHQAIRFKYDAATNNVLVQGDKGFMRNAPYSSSFFNIDFSADVIRWNLEADSMNIFIQGGRAIVPMVLESTDYYDPDDFWLLKGQGFDFHPLSLFANYSIQNDTLEFYAGDLINSTRIDPAAIKMAIEFLQQKGMLTYNPLNDRVRMRERAVHLLKAYKNEADYDNLKIHSYEARHPNATINFADRIMTVRGVEEFKVSDSLNVVITPDSSLIQILQNRDIKFNGTVRAGNFEITGKDFTLKYDSFFINLRHIDSINFYTIEKNALGQEVRRKMNNAMVGADSVAAAEGGLGDTSQSSGTLYISYPNNKSGKIRVPNYPRLDATTGGVIYFDRQEVLGGVYDRSVFFVVPPFKLDSLNDADPASVNFDGTFVSSGMFPSFQEKLHTMPDKSLGFIHAIPQPGYQLFKGDGKVNGLLRLDNNGLRVEGTIDYLAASVTSNDFIFYPDSVITTGVRTELKESQFGAVRFPQASLSNYKMKWLPKLDQMQFVTTDKQFNFYDSIAWFTGRIALSKSGVTGYGRLETKETELVSRDQSFTATDFSARRARFIAKSADPNKPLVSGTDVRVRYNLEERFADISPEVEGVAAIEFPYAQFKTSIPNAHLDLDEQKITMSKRPDVAIENSYFYTTRKDLDSLSFYAEEAEYDLKNQQLKVRGIPYITVADARITPQNNEVLILENARIGQLTNTTIILDTLNGYHRLTEGVIDIVSRKEFNGYATYQYVNLENDTFAIKMTNFHLEPVEAVQGSSGLFGRKNSTATMQTVATGAVDESEHLVLGAGMFYKGQMTMYATKPALQLTGFVKMDIKKIPDYNTWIRYTQSGDETEVQLDFNNAVSENGNPIDAGLHFNANDQRLYISFASEKLDDDETFFQPEGILHFSNETNEYRIEDLQKASGEKLSGKVFAYNDDNSLVRFEGPIKLFTGTSDFTVTASALGTGNMETEEINMNSFVMITPNIPVEILNIMALDLQEVIKNEGAQEGHGDQTELLYKIADIVGERAVKDYEQRSLQSYVPLTSIPALNQPLVFSNVNLKWSDEHKAFYSLGGLGLSNILRNDINGLFEGYMESKRTTDGGMIFNLFIKASPDSWYYFGYEDNRLLIHSSVPAFNSAVAKRTNAGKAKIGQMVFVPGSDEETRAFVNRFRAEYQGIQVPYNLYEGSTVPVQSAPAPGNNQPVPQQPQPGDQPGNQPQQDQPKPRDDGF